MNIFISWSGAKSRAIAEALTVWLPKVIQAVKPFYSPEIEKGARSIEEINSSLEGTTFGIICLTPENRESTWIHYEAGALAKTKDARIWTLLHGLDHSDVAQPLAQFQNTITSFEDMSILLKSINQRLENPLQISVLEDSHQKWWPDLEAKLAEIDKNFKKPAAKGLPENIRSDRDVLNEILEILRSQRIQESQESEFLSRLRGLPRLSGRSQFSGGAHQTSTRMQHDSSATGNSSDPSDDIPF